MRKSSWIAVAVLASACSTFESYPPGGDDMPEDNARHTYVVSRIVLPTSAAEAVALGVDVDQLPNDGIDNQLGNVLASFGTLVPDLAPGAVLAGAIDRGIVLPLIDVRADSLVTDAGASARLHVGLAPQPAPCRQPGDPVCRQHLDGSGTFSLAPDFSGGLLVGNVIDGQLAAGGGDFVVPFSLVAGAVAFVPLRLGRVQLRLDADGVRAGSRVGGAIGVRDLDNTVLVQLHAGARAIVVRDCGEVRTPPTCGCRAGSSGEQLLGFFDAVPDCDASLAEFLDVVHGIANPDVDLDGDGVADAVSFGFGVQAVGATFPAP